MKPTDTQLIAQFTKHADQAAFTQLVERYVDIAYAAAITYLGKDDLARDACQLTFLEFSRKAAHLPASVKLGGWIYATSRNFSRNILRGEMRHQKREQTYADQMKPEFNIAPDWSQLTPEIHEALDALKPIDRDVVILRFFQKKSHAEVGKSLGISTDAARMKLNRALSRLSQKLSSKGITSTAAALASALPAHAMITAPAGLATSVSTSVLASAGTLSFTTLTTSMVTLMKAKTIIIASCATATLLVGGVYIAKSSYSNEYLTDSAPSTNPTQQSQFNKNGALNPDKQNNNLGQNTSDGSNTDFNQKTAQTNTSTQTRSFKELPLHEPLDLSTIQWNGKEIYLDPTALKQAEHAIAMLKRKTASKNKNDELGPKATQETLLLAHRLGLDANQTSTFKSILLAHAEMQANQPNPYDSDKIILDADPTEALHYLTLGNPSLQLSKDQTEYKNYLQGNIFKSAFSHAQKPTNVVWNKDDDVINQLYGQLTAEQQDEFNALLTEKSTREHEQNAYKKSMTLANDLGLDDRDRTTLYGFFYQNENPTSDEVQAKIDSLRPFPRP